MQALIDGDIIVYRAGFACQKKNEEGEVVVEPLPFCLHTVKLMLENILDVTNSQDYKIFLTGKHNFRLDVDPMYKSNRKDTPKPVHYDDIRNYLINVWKAEVINGMEADDAMGLCQHENSVICSIDKDMLMVEGNHYNFVKDEWSFTTPEDAEYKFYAQMLTGDSTDFIPGIYGMAETGAVKLLSEIPIDEWDKLILDKYEQEAERSLLFMEGEWSPKRVSAYAEYGFKEFSSKPAIERMQQNAELLWIKQTGKEIPINFERLENA